ncbi:hypothetical protein [Fructobacillus parabroussonetiae]|uniref:Uncharacterized protein n=1 Tax=Fructobacillus parabroussonetiae TaxID=2713174 RepID=A0ABS5QV67_9LACO|nr:hypothetical protein [Fructobacillus parabroussonetiae]MBS9337090.1 hypothetical protein [Fructobacillus parabroussonetiae]
MKTTIKDLQLKRREYWVSLQLVHSPNSPLPILTAEGEENPVLDYRVLCFSFGDYLVIDWLKSFPGPNPLNLVMSHFQEGDLTKLDKSHGLISFETTGIGDQATYRIVINTLRS